MAQQQLIMAIGRIERALSRIEQVPAAPAHTENDQDLALRHERLKAETRVAIEEIEKLLMEGAA